MQRRLHGDMRATRIHTDEGNKGPLPKPQGEHVDADETQDRAETIESQFEATLGLRESLSVPVLCPDGSMKKRVAALEQSMEMQIRRDDVTYQNIMALSKDGQDRQERLKLSVKEDILQVMDQMVSFQQEVRHRFELQSAENKRLNQHVASLRQDNRQLHTDLATALEKLQKIEMEFSDGPEDGLVEK